MKKIYMNPEAVVIALSTADILTESVEKEQDLWIPVEQDKDWSSLIGNYTIVK